MDSFQPNGLYIRSSTLPSSATLITYQNAKQYAVIDWLQNIPSSDIRWVYYFVYIRVITETQLWHLLQDHQDIGNNANE